MKMRMPHLRSLHSAGMKVASSPHLSPEVKAKGQNLANMAKREMDLGRSLSRSFAGRGAKKPKASPLKVEGAQIPSAPNKGATGAVSLKNPALKAPGIPKLP